MTQINPRGIELWILIIASITATLTEFARNIAGLLDKLVNLASRVGRAIGVVAIG
jgi:hypothetical protein